MFKQSLKNIVEIFFSMVLWVGGEGSLGRRGSKGVEKGCDLLEMNVDINFFSALRWEEILSKPVWRGTVVRSCVGLEDGVLEL